MLQQMPAPPIARVCGVAVVRTAQSHLVGHVTSRASSDTTVDLELPQCKIRRNYNCTKCTFCTQNPRAFLVHTRDDHLQRLKIYDCPHCIYASRHQQKLTRHLKMMHVESSASSTSRRPPPAPRSPGRVRPPPAGDNYIGFNPRQMPSPPIARAGEVAAVVRMVESRLGSDVSSGASSDTADDFELPHSKIRNYSCTQCTFYTQNPRAFLVHTRDDHFQKLRIYDCPHCIYASRHQRKLFRHVKMVHRVSSPAAVISMDCESPHAVEQRERVEDLLEEVEECEDSHMDADDGIEECIERTDDVENDRHIDRTVAGIPTPKGNFFSCDKCNYVTHIRSRYTKHVKYHSMPMIKCTICEFRTPYKWNLDRHMKNHGGTGSFHCSMCNFTADIKQSLTVHEMNHHTPAAGQSAPNRRRNRVGGSEIVLDMPGPMLPKEEEGSGDSRSSVAASDMGIHFADKDMVSCHSDSNEAIDANKDESQSPPDGRGQWSPSATSDDARNNRHNKKPPRPIPQLIPLNASTPNQTKATGEPPAKRLKETPVAERASNDITKNERLSPDITIIPIGNSCTIAKDIVGRNKNVSFFDRLKERLLTETGEEGSLICKSCGFESKCLSEHSGHEKNCTAQSNRLTANASHTNLGSTRCQNCRHRCKSSADLYIHMRSCKKSGTVGDSNSTGTNNSASNESSNMNIEKEVEPHPMENVVFVWNNINNDTNKFETPLDINIKDDSTLPELAVSFEVETAEENDNMNLSPSQAVGKRVFKCPYCQFWASTASRFHVHIVGHLNKKPFECSLCRYKSNWRWDITKHIKLKSARDPEHNDAKVLMTDETGRRNYSKYNKFLAMPVMNENGENKFHYIDPNTAVDSTIEVDEPFNDHVNAINDSFEIQPLNLQTQHTDTKYDQYDSRGGDPKKPKKTLWKCKKCHYKDPSKEALLEHVREHARADGNLDDSKELAAKKPENMPDPADLAYRCGHCNQLSNWKHVIQRHCRLKHDGIIKVITTIKPKSDDPLTINDICSDTCSKCPFKTSDRNLLLAHMQHHQPSPQSIFKCYFCPYFVKEESELMEHLHVHGIIDVEDYLAKSMSSSNKSPPPEPQGTVQITHSTKRHKCTECPYETNSKSQYMYHEQFHRLPADTPYKCPECNYSVSKRHLLHQHLRVHGILPKKNESEAELEAATSLSIKNEKPEFEFEEIQFVWVSAKNEFHKMYKCRYCSYVHSQKCKLPNHEKIHCVAFDNNDVTIFKCLECKFTCDNAGRLAEHSKSHGEIYGRIYCPVEENIPDDEQIAKLRKVIEAEKANATDDSFNDEIALSGSKEIKILSFCRKCPARFYSDNELRLHDKFHDLSFSHKCKSCAYSTHEESELTSHTDVHSDEYHTKTKMLKFIHHIHPAHKEPQLELKHCPNTSEIAWVVANPSKNFSNDFNIKKVHDTKHTPKQHNCKECPARFFKSSALSYHVGLHGGEGEHKCKKCSYAVKNVGNLAKHEILHENEGKTSNHDYDSGDEVDFKNIPLSGTDLFQRKTEAQKRVLTDKDKLVKPNDHFPPVLQADPQFGYLMHGNPEFIYPTYLKNGRQKEKRYKCHKCPSAFEKREQYKIHLSLHGSKQRYKCELCDYSVKYYANYVQHMRKHQMNDEAQAERKKSSVGYIETENPDDAKVDDGADNIKLAIKTMPKGIPKSDFQLFSISDQQTLRLLQRRRSMMNSSKDPCPTEQSPTKERKLHMCILCPYTNQRQDALNNHYRRHDETDIFNAGNHHKCSHCDLVVVQSHFLRDHMKTHFNYQKSLIPECFVANEDVSFTITKIDDNNQSVDLVLDMQSNSYACSDEKIFVKMTTGELAVE